MFSGIVETTGKILKLQSHPDAIHMTLERPALFTDLKIGDSVAVDGVCLTVRELQVDSMSFDVGYETLQITHWQQRLPAAGVNLQPQVGMNLERSLKFGDRMHGHVVTGHVEALAMLQESKRLGDSLVQRYSYPWRLRELLWTKGSVALNGVSLTINDICDDHFEVCLIPETQERTNLGVCRLGDWLHIETDSMAKSISHFLTHSPLLKELLQKNSGGTKDLA